MRRSILSLRYILIWLASCMFLQAHAESDTLRMTLPDAEKQFLQKNLVLIAQRYNVNINEAAIHQAKLWDNPNLSVSTNVYDGAKYPFYHGNSNHGGQIDLQWSELFKIGGQHKKLSAVLTDNAQVSEAQFNDMMNSLRLTLHNDFYALAGMLEMNGLYRNELEALQPLVKGMESQFQAGNISSKENIRIKALEYALRSDLLENEKQVSATEAELKELLHEPEDTFVFPVADLHNTQPVPASAFLLDSLLSIAKQNRPDYKAALLQNTLQEHNLSYQRSLGVPDMSVGMEYDKANSYAKNYVGLSVSMPLPVFNRNQVNVQEAKIGIEQQKAWKDVLESKIRNDIYEALQKLTLATELQNTSSTDFTSQYDVLLSKMVESYRQKQLGLIEFIDFLDSYTSTKEKIINQQTDVKNSIEQLNYACGTVIINPN